MTRQTVLGQHPAGPKGLFIAKSGVDAHTADPNAIDPWIFSSQWSRVGSILVSGQCGLNQSVGYPATGFKPVIWFCQYSGNTLSPDGITSYTVIINANYAVNYTQTQFKVVHGENNFQIQFMEPSDPGSTNVSFYFVVFNLPA